MDNKDSIENWYLNQEEIQRKEFKETEEKAFLTDPSSFDSKSFIMDMSTCEIIGHDPSSDSLDVSHTGYYITDQETGELIEVTKEEIELREKFRKAMLTIKSSFIGKAIILGTRGEIDNSNFKNIWYNPTE